MTLHLRPRGWCAPRLSGEPTLVLETPLAGASASLRVVVQERLPEGDCGNPLVSTCIVTARGRPNCHESMRSDSLHVRCTSAINLIYRSRQLKSYLQTLARWLHVLDSGMHLQRAPALSSGRRGSEDGQTQEHPCTTAREHPDTPLL